MTLQPAAGPIPLKPSFKFKPGTLFAGFDLAAELDKSCPHWVAPHVELRGDVGTSARSPMAS